MCHCDREIILNLVLNQPIDLHFLANISKPEDLPIGTALKVVGFDDRGIVLEKL